MTNNSQMKYILSFFEERLEFFIKNTILSLLIIGIVGLIIRAYYLPFEIPITLDGLLYFWYANDISISGHLPTSYASENNVWPIFLSMFFVIFHFNNFMDYMALQRIITVSISVLTIIPVYLLCNRFFAKPYALFGAAIFAFEPRIIQNSLFGITDPLYLFTLAISLFLFLSSKKKIMYVSFGIAALASLVRYEGMFLFFLLSVLFFLRYRKERKVIVRYSLAAAIFVLTLLPMAIIRIEITGQDSLSSNIQSAPTEIASLSKETGLISFLIIGVTNLIKFLGWIMIPVFIFFVPFGFLWVLKNKKEYTIPTIATTIILLMPVLYAFTIRAFDTRYFFPLYPIFCVLSIVTAKWISEKTTNRNIILVLLIGGVLLSSVLFLDIKKIDIDHEKEALSLAYHVVNETKVINQYLPESKYITIVGMTELEKFPVLYSDFKEPILTLDLNANTVEEYIILGKEDGLTHLVLDGIENLRRPQFFKEVFEHEEKYPYLIKEFDSWDYGYKYHIKIYKINYEEFELINNVKQ